MNKNRKQHIALTQTILQLMKDKKPQTVNQLINSVKEKTSIQEQKIIEAILQLQSQGKIKLKEPSSPSPQKLHTYLKTKEAYWYWTTMILVIATTLTIFTIPENAYPIIYTRYFFGTVFVLWLPGYSFMKALFPSEPTLRTSSKSLDSTERIALNIGMSLALVALVGLLLNYTQWGIRLTPIVLSLLILTTILATAAITREYKAKTRPIT